MLLLCIILGSAALLQLVRSENNARRQTRIQEDKVIASLLEQSINNSLLSVKHQLLILSKVPLLRKFEKKPLLAPRIEKFRQDLGDLLSAYQLDIGNAYRDYLLLQSDMVYWSELPMALWRRIVYEFSIFKQNDNSRDDFDKGYFADIGSALTTDNFAASSELNRIYAKTNFVRSLFFLVKEWLNELLKTLSRLLDKFDGFVGLGHSSVADKLEAEKFIMATISDNKTFSGLELCNQFGRSQLSFRQKGLLQSADHLKEAISYLEHRRSYYIGGVNFLFKSSEAYLQAAAAIRGFDRQFVGFLRAAINIEYFENLINKFALSKDRHIYLIDKSSRLLAASSKNARHEFSAVAEKLQKFSVAGNKTNNTFVDSGARKRILSLPLSEFKTPGIPDWRVVVVTGIARQGFVYSFLTIVLLILLAVTGVYAVFYTAVELAELNKEEAVND